MSLKLWHGILTEADVNWGIDVSGKNYVTYLERIKLVWV